MISIHAPRVGSDRAGRQIDPVLIHFNPRSPCGERLFRSKSAHFLHDFNPRSPCGERLAAMPAPPPTREISIHAPRVGSDDRRADQGHCRPGISIHAPRVGSDGLGGKYILFHFLFQSTLPVWGATCLAKSRMATIIFQSTLPVWGATRSPRFHGDPPRNFNPRSPCGERRGHLRITPRCLPDFNPRSPCGERLKPPPVVLRLRSIFQSTLPVWGATVRVLEHHGVPVDFNPRSPCGERPCWLVPRSRVWRFQSTLPVWGATWSRPSGSGTRPDFNPRSPCGERPRAGGSITIWWYFNPRSPCGERPDAGRASLFRLRHFNPRSPCGERRKTGACCSGTCSDFNPRSPCGERPRLPGRDPHCKGFQSTLPVWGATRARVPSRRVRLFQSTLPVWGATRPVPAGAGPGSDFNPRSPCGERPAAMGDPGS